MYCIDYIANDLKRNIMAMKAATSNEEGKSEEEIKYNNKRARMLIEKLELTQEKLSLPFPINDGKLNQDKTVDIRYHNKRLAEWTTAIRYMLIDCKHLIALQNNIDAYEQIEL